MPRKEIWAKMTEEQKKKESDRMKEWRAKNKDKTCEYQRQARKRRPDLELKANLKRYYGMTIGDYHKLQEEQNFSCAICETTLSGSKRTEKLFVDHCHDSGKVRGLLCMKCNMALGVFKTRKLLEKAAKYLNKQEQINIGVDSRHAVQRK